MLDSGIPKTTLHVTLTKCHVPWQTLLLLLLLWPDVEAQSCWCKLSSTTLLAQTCPRSFSHLHYMIPQKIRNVCSQIFFCAHPCLATCHKKGNVKTYMRPQLCQGFALTGLSAESSPATAPIPRISALKMNFCSSYTNPLPRDMLWSRGMCLNIQNTLLIRERK